MSEGAVADTDAEALVAQLDAAAEAYERADERVAEAGEARIRRLREHYEEITSLMDRYEARATSDGDGDVDMEAFIEYQEKLAHFVQHLPEELEHREAFEQVDEIMHQKWLKQDDFADARDALAPIASLVERLDEREAAAERYDEARQAAEARERELRARIEDLQRLVELGDADLDAPVERLRDPIESYNDAVTTAFDELKQDGTAREVLAFVESTDAFPLVEYRQPPADLAEYVAETPAGTETIPQLLEYADYSKSKLDHYVEDAAALKRHVATHQTYLRRLSGGPLTVSWPPPEAEALRWRCKEFVSAVSRLDADVLPELRTVRSLADRAEYSRLRTSAVARTQLSDEERDRLQRGAVQSELASAREAREALRTALSAYDPR